MYWKGQVGMEGLDAHFFNGKLQVSECDLHAKIGTRISSSANFSERKKVIERIHPERSVVGMMSLISSLFVPTKLL